MSKKIAFIVAVATLVMGIGTFAGGVFGVAYTYDHAAKQNIVTGDDAAIPNAPVRGPLTMKAQKDNIEKHTLARTDGKYYAEMDRSDETRSMWITATTLTTALGLGILAYLVSAWAVILGLYLIGLGTLGVLYARRI